MNAVIGLALGLVAAAGWALVTYRQHRPIQITTNRLTGELDDASKEKMARSRAVSAAIMGLTFMAGFIGSFLILDSISGRR